MSPESERPQPEPGEQAFSIAEQGAQHSEVVYDQALKAIKRLELSSNRENGLPRAFRDALAAVTSESAPDQPVSWMTQLSEMANRYAERNMKLLPPLHDLPGTVPEVQQFDQLCRAITDIARANKRTNWLWYVVGAQRIIRTFLFKPDHPNTLDHIQLAAMNEKMAAYLRELELTIKPQGDDAVSAPPGDATRSTQPGPTGSQAGAPVAGRDTVKKTTLERINSDEFDIRRIPLRMRQIRLSIRGTERTLNVFGEAKVDDILSL